MTLSSHADACVAFGVRARHAHGALRGRAARFLSGADSNLNCPSYAFSLLPLLRNRETQKWARKVIPDGVHQEGRKGRVKPCSFFAAAVHCATQSGRTDGCVNGECRLGDKSEGEREREKGWAFSAWLRDRKQLRPPLRPSVHRSVIPSPFALFPLPFQDLSPSPISTSSLSLI